MKRAVLILFVFISLTAISQTKSNLTISTTGTSNLKIRLGEYRYSLQDRTTTFQEMNPGTYDLVIYQWQKKPDGNSDYVQVYNKNVQLTAGRHTEISILRFGKVSWDEGPIVADNWNDNYNNPWPSQGGYQHNRNVQAVDATQFAQIRKTINSEFGDANMLSVAKVALKNNLFTCAQIKDIAKLFFTDDTKLSFTKYAYDYVVDKGNYITVGDVFYSSLVKKELLYYIGNK